MKTNILNLFLWPTIICIQAHAFNLSDYVNESIYHDRTDKELEITTAAGLGNQNNSLGINDQRLELTNRNYAILAVNINDNLSLNLSIPFKDPAQARQSRVDSEVRCYSLSYDLSPNVKTSALYSKNKGYYLEDASTHLMYKLPDLSFDQTSLTFFYLTNEKHQSAYLNPLLTKKADDSSSFIFSLGYAHFEASNLDQLNILPNTKSERINSTGIISSHIEALRAQVIYSKNWFWQHWFATGSIGYQLGTDFNKKSYAVGDTRNENKMSTGATVSFSGGYIWTRLAAGAYVRLTQTHYEIDEMSLDSNIGNSGGYLSYQF